MNNHWQLQHAKSRFSELVEKALNQGPQMVTRNGKETVVVVSAKEFKTLTPSSKNLVEFFASSPLGEAKLDLTRSKDSGRKVRL